MHEFARCSRGIFMERFAFENFPTPQGVKDYGINLNLEMRIMSTETIRLGGKKESKFIDKVRELLPEGGNLNLCLTCGACSSGCPATP